PLAKGGTGGSVLKLTHHLRVRPLYRLSAGSGVPNSAWRRSATIAMKTRRTILMICPAPRGSRKGNRITAVRWARLLRQLGHRVMIRQDYGGERCDAMIALHARRSAPAIRRFAREQPGRPLVVALTG